MSSKVVVTYVTARDDDPKYVSRRIEDFLFQIYSYEYSLQSINVVHHDSWCPSLLDDDNDCTCAL